MDRVRGGLHLWRNNRFWHQEKTPLSTPFQTMSLFEEGIQIEHWSPNQSASSQSFKLNTNYLDRFLKATTIAPDLLQMHV